MMTNNKSKHPSLKHFLLTLFFMLCLTACGKEEETPELGINGYIYQSRQIQVEGQYFIENLKVKDGSLYFMDFEIIYSLPIEENINFNNRKSLAGSSGLTDYCIGQDETLYYVTIQYILKDMQSVPAGCTLVQKAGDSAKGWKKPFPDINISRNEKCLAADGNGHVFLLSEDKLYQINSNGKIEDTIALENYQFSGGGQKLVTGSEGKVYYCASPSRYGSNDETWRIYEITEAEDSPLKEITGRAGMPCSSAYGLLCESSDGIVYQYRGEPASWEPVFRWGDSCLSSYNTNANGLVQLDEDNFSALLVDVVSEDFAPGFYQLTRTAVSELPEKEILVLACTGYVPDEIKHWVSQFNRENGKYHIMVEQYGWDERETKLNSRLVSSNPPDLVDVSRLDVVSYAKRQTFEDLAPFLEASDILDKDMFFDKLLEAYTIDGKLVCIPKGFYMNTVFGRESEVGSGIGWTAEEVMALADRYPDRRLLATYEERLARELFGTYLCEHYIDWESGECTFDSEEFCGFLEWLKAYVDRIRRVGYEYTYEYMAKDCLLYMEDISRLSNRIRQENVLGEELSLIGLPTPDSRPCVPVEIKDSLSITSKSKHKEGAWQFLEYFLSREEGRSSSFPSRQDIFQRELEKEMTPEYWYTEDGEIDMLDGSPWMKPKGWTNDGEALYYYMSQEQADAIMEIIDVLDFTPQGDTESIVLNIFDEESAVYLAGGRSAKETAEIIQNRVKNLVQENL